MSTVLISALAAAAFAAVPPSIGSEPVPANFEYVPAPAQHVALQGPNLAVSLGSEPMLAGVESGAPQAATPGQHAAAAATLAASLGSEPLIVSFEDGKSGTSNEAPDRRVAAAAPQSGAATSACTCAM